ncbi:MAG TPA: iron chelate uptake ABC transporter family permease subunit [Hyphomicrobium sp.]|nr:iron chelate uptake ABC transporter family permease subunit [Hyphomicrobium sp.]
MSDRSRKHSAKAVVVLSVGALLAIVAFMTVGASGPWSYVLPHRGAKLAAILLVACSTAVSTILFQTVTANRILTPSLIGLDSLFMLIQTALIFVAGSNRIATLDPRILFLAQVAAMMGFSILLYRTLFAHRQNNLPFVLLVGIVAGAFFQSLAGLMQRIMAPNEFVVLQDRLFANFNTVHTDILVISALMLAAASVAAYRLLHTYDVLALGRETAISLGIDYPRTTFRILLIVSVMVGVSTALVGPIMFLGLLVAGLAHQIAGSSRHRALLPVAVLLSVILLVGGQLILERVFAFDTAISIVIEFVGGLYFILLILRGQMR